jgi:hypothetical protein
MIDKDKSLQELIDLIFKTFGRDTFIIRDYWDDFFAIGLERNKKLIYICRYGSRPEDYFYECEILLDSEDMPYKSYESDNADTKKIMSVIESFFEIKGINRI